MFSRRVHITTAFWTLCSRRCRRLAPSLQNLSIVPVPDAPESKLINYGLSWPLGLLSFIVWYLGFPPGGGGYSPKNWVGVCGPLPKTLTLFMTQIWDFPYPIYDLIKNLIPYLWPDPYINTLFQTCLMTISLVQTSVKGNVYLLLLGRLQDYMCKEVASSKKTNSRLECNN